jgi:hypothetical protein
MEKDGVHGEALRESGMEGEMLLFLYAKGLLAGAPSVIRVMQFDNLLQPWRADVSDEEKAKLAAGQNRLLSIVVFGERGTPIAPGDDTFAEFAEFARKIPAWSDPDKSFVMFRDHPDLKGKNALVERLQWSGLCYMHAPIVLQHYLVQMRRTDRVGMLDMGVYLRQHVSAERLQALVWTDAGADSASFLDQILLPGSKVRWASSNGADWLSEMRECGPLLVSGMDIEPSFKEEGTLVHTGEKKGPILGKHAMVLVGHRREGNEDRFLIQNWWKRKVRVICFSRFFLMCCS